MADENDKYEEDIDKLIDTGKEKGYLTFGEVNDLLPGDITTPDDLDDLLTTINTQGIDVLNGEYEFFDAVGRWPAREATVPLDRCGAEPVTGAEQVTRDRGHGVGVVADRHGPA